MSKSVRAAILPISWRNELAISWRFEREANNETRQTGRPVPVLLWTIANKKLNRKDLEELTRYVDEKFGATCDGVGENPRTL